MKKLLDSIMKYLKKPIYWLITGSFTLIIAACYGPPIGSNNPNSKKLKVTDEQNQPIKDIVIALNQVYTNTGTNSQPVVATNLDNIKFTDSNGNAELTLPTYTGFGQYFIKISDIDGVSNRGDFLSTNLYVSLIDTNALTVKLQKSTNN